MKETLYGAVFYESHESIMVCQPNLFCAFSSNDSKASFYCLEKGALVRTCTHVTILSRQVFSRTPAIISRRRIYYGAPCEAVIFSGLALKTLASSMLACVHGIYSPRYYEKILVISWVPCSNSQTEKRL